MSSNENNPALKYASLPRLNAIYFAWLLRASLAEAVATGFFTFMGCGSVVFSRDYPTSARVILIALAHGFGILVLVSATCGLTGGHLNPAVTITFVATGRMDVLTGFSYVASQLLGGILGVGLLKFIVGSNAAGLGAHALGAGISPGKGVVLEIVLTALLIFTIWGTAVDDKGPTTIAPLCIGFTIMLDHLVGIPVTGASMNPARSLAPAIWANKWDHHWIYWIGPLVGGLLAGFIYNHVLLYQHRPCSQPREILLEEICDKVDG